MTYKVDIGGLHLSPDGNSVPIGSDEWLAWLNTAKSFRFECGCKVDIPGTSFSHDSLATFTAVRNGKYWQAHKKVKGVLRREHLGLSEALTYELMRQKAEFICNPRYDRIKEQEKVKSESHKISKRETEVVSSLQPHERIAELEEQLKQASYRITTLTNEVNRLERVGVEYSQATFNALSRKREEAFKDAENWKKQAEGYRKQAEKLKRLLDECEDNKPVDTIVLLEEFLSIAQDKRPKPTYEGMVDSPRYDQLSRFKIWLLNRGQTSQVLSQPDS